MQHGGTLLIHRAEPLGLAQRQQQPYKDRLNYSLHPSMPRHSYYVSPQILY